MCGQIMVRWQSVNGKEWTRNVLYDTTTSELREEQKEAMDMRLGIWGAKGLKERPRDYRKKHPRV